MNHLYNTVPHNIIILYLKHPFDFRTLQARHQFLQLKPNRDLETIIFILIFHPHPPKLQFLERIQRFSYYVSAEQQKKAIQKCPNLINPLVLSFCDTTSAAASRAYSRMLYQISTTRTSEFVSFGFLVLSSPSLHCALLKHYSKMVF